jgi:8-oxo-dGTP pyrophosphatase MutT (NUDIX family)
MDLLEVDGPNPWRTESHRVVYDNGRLRVHEDGVVQPDGHPGMYAYVEVLAPVVAVVPIDEQQHVYLVRQWRYPWRRNSWEIPSGGAEHDESPLAGAQRELAEEVGLAAGDWELLGTGYSSASMDSHWHFFLARGLTTAPGDQHRDGGEHDMLVRRIPLAAAIDAAMDGRIVHGMSVAALLRAARRLRL